MGINYKTLFEVKVLHEFYLTEPRGESIFDFNLPNDRLKFLRERFELNRKTVNTNLAYEIPSTLQSIFKGYHLRLIPSFSGFKVMAEVHAKTLSSGTRIYRPVFELPEDLSIIIGMVKKDNGADAFSNARRANTLPATYYFTNDTIGSPKTFPSLSTAISSVNSLSEYEMGELASFGLNDIRQFTGAPGTPWQSVNNFSYVNENDRLLISSRSKYAFGPSDNIKQATYHLKDKSGATIKSFESKDDDGLKTVSLDFSHRDLITFPSERDHEKNIYKLEVSGDNGYERKFQLLIADSSQLVENYWGFIHIRPRVTNSVFNIIDNEGLLITRKQLNGDVVDHPIFELGIKSRLRYWRYIHQKKKRLKLSAGTTEFLDNQDGKLVTKKPRGSTFLPCLFKSDATNTHFFLPNPETSELLTIGSGRQFMDIQVAESDLFPLDST